MINERELAVVALTDITSGSYNNIALRKILRGADKSVSRSFVTELVNGVIRNLIYIDYTLSVFVKSGVKRPFITNVLRAGAYQLLFMDARSAAVVNESVNIVKKRGFGDLSAFINGVLRNIERTKNDMPLPEKGTARYLSIKYSCPEWIVEYWLNDMSFDEVESMCAANLTKPAVTVCVNALKTDRLSLIKILADEGVSGAPLRGFPNAVIMTKTQDISKMTVYKDGLFHVMDSGAMAAVDIMDPKPGDTIIDACAAPGGKSFYCAEKMKNTGRIIAIDKYPRKIDMLLKSADTLGINIIEARTADSAAVDPSLENSADALLLDAPCSGLGVLRKKPDIKYNKTMDDVIALAETQRALLSACASRVKPGGTLTYSVCTVSRAETRDIADWFAQNFNFELENIQAENFINSSEIRQETIEENYDDMLVFNTFSYSDKCVALLPHQYDGDGFFIAKFRKA
jgi:16S rRNA (cytosine967-C5)-methyltransferase